MTSARIVGVGMTPLNLPMRRPFVTALGRKRVSRNLLVAVRLADGTIGYGEASASLAWPDETQATMTGALRQITGSLIGTEIRRFRSLIAESWERIGRHPTAVGALECALLDAFTRSRKTSLWRWLGARRRSVTTSLTISAWPAADAVRFAQSAYRHGFRWLKVKVTGTNIREDIQRLLAVHHVAPKAALWVDANQGFTTGEAIRFVSMIRRHGLPVRLLEQPVPRADLEGLAAVQREGKIPVVADESARTVADAARIIQRRRAAVINIKLAKSGLLGALEIVHRAKKAGVQLMIGCMAESVIGLSSSVALACGTGAFDFVDLDSHLLVISPRCTAGFSTEGARLTIHPRRVGNGVIFQQ